MDDRIANWRIEKSDNPLMYTNKKVKKRLSLHLTLTGNITRRYWLLPVMTTIINTSINNTKVKQFRAFCKLFHQKFSTPDCALYVHFSLLGQ